MALTADQVFDIAADAVIDLHKTNGDSYRFSFDEIWDQTATAAAVPSERRPGQSRRLISEKYIEKTGAFTRAKSAARAGSPTTEYRFGNKLVSSVSHSPTPTTTLTVSDALSELNSRLESAGYVFSLAELTNFYLAMTVSPLVILSGTSGTGKSLLPRMFSEATGSAFFPIAVQPQWSDNSDLFGYVPTLAPTTYSPGELIAPLRMALANPDKVVVVLLDEMNLAPVEHYFSDFLSVIESRRRDAGRIITDCVPIALPTGGDSHWDDLRAAYVPPNLRVVGTANMDETTRSFSAKVLDRAFAIEFDEADLTAFSDSSGGARSTSALTSLVAPLLSHSDPVNVFEARPSNEDLFDLISQLLSEVQAILAPAGVRFGYRSRDSILMYLWRWRQLDLGKALTDNAAFDLCILQKILPRISGTGEQLAKALDELADWLELDREKSGSPSTVGFNGPYIRSAEKTRRMLNVLQSEGAAHFWGV